MEFIQLPGGQTLAYEQAGSGEPLLLVMGTGADHTFWGAQVQDLSRSYRVITFDSRGTGASGDFDRPEACTPRSLAKDVEQLLLALDTGPAHVAGLSLGSCVAQELALSRPDLVRSLGLHGTWAVSDAWFLHMVEGMELALRHGGLEAFIRCATTWILSPDYHALHADSVAALERAYVEASPRTRVEGVLAHCHADRVHDTLARLGDIRVPTLVTAGERDIQVPPRYGRQVAEAIPGARFEVFTGPLSSHCACFEMADAFNALTRQFISRLGGGPGSAAVS